jgi:hypothetical protein
MKTVAMILELATPLQAGFHIRIENEPWMTLVIEDTQGTQPERSAGIGNPSSTRAVALACARKHGSARDPLSQSDSRNGGTGRQSMGARPKSGR